MKKKTPEIKIVLDTNALYTKDAYYLCKKAIGDLITEESGRNDINIAWHLPQTVINERNYQMIVAIEQLWPNIEKLQQILGHNLNITKDLLIKRIQECIEDQIKAFNISVIDIDESQVNLKELIQRACFRLPPFSYGKEEKGFRDALIAETFFQFLSNTPKSVDKIIFVTNDGLLKKHLEDGIKDRKNVHILSEIEELIGLLNTLASHLDETTIKKYQQLVSKYFFEEENRECIYYKKNISQQIQDKFKTELSMIPEMSSLKRKNNTWYINQPQFLEKNKTTIKWATRIEMQFELYTEEVVPKVKEVRTSPSIFRNDKGLFSIPPKGFVSIFDSTSNDYEVKKEITSQGKTIFEVQWEIRVSAKNKLTHLKILDINYIDTIWEVI
ncbi:PIN domain-containing protein [Legionella bozemanae]|uniref:DUF4935 domain-containing protein n=1 Tax=Legionella bozemanae TaxID=447 RepID=A0A0W0R9T2_LEGBO|nr:PIN domain-containing protein [Legionella bozemanae]KTC67839.1 hypothetical protein Lboz_3482 [Legionella bozemanae]STP14008.1 Uncharacterised protein [Legionella bozemanae]